MITQAVILAAGKGSRLRAGGVPLIKRTILTLAEAGVRRFVVVTGFMGDLLRETLHRDVNARTLGIELVLAHNFEHEKSNGISVIVGGAAIEGPFLLSLTDHMYTPALARRIGSQNLEVADVYLATEPCIFDIPGVEDATRVRSDGTHILDIGKQIETYDRIDCGVFAVTQRLRDALIGLRAKHGDCSLSDGVKHLATARRARIADIGDGFWQDVERLEPAFAAQTNE